MSIGDTVALDISGLGIILLSSSSAEHIAKGENYLEHHYWEPEDVERHCQAGTIVGFATGSPGKFRLLFLPGYPAEERATAASFKLRLGVRVTGASLCVRDLYDLMVWEPECPEGQQLSLDDGIYHVTLLSEVPPSGVLGRDQLIEVYLQKLESWPALRWPGVPTLVDAGG